MKVDFLSIRAKNFLSIGDQFETFDLQKYPFTVITGPNGTGKSTLIDMVTYALFKKPFRKIKLNQLINLYNKKKMVVEIAFNVGGSNYIVRRGEKPKLFEIYKDKKLIEEDPSIGDYQNFLEENVLKQDFKTFCQINVIGKATYTPFMQLDAASRRSFIEDLLDTHVYSVMQSLAKDYVKKFKEDQRETETQLTITNDKIETVTKLIEQHKEQSTTKVNQIKEQIETLEDENKNFINMVSSKQEELDSLVQDQEQNDLEIKKFSDIFTKSEELIEKIAGSKSQLNSKSESLKSLKESLSELEKDKVQYDSTITSLKENRKEVIKQLNSFESDYNDLPTGAEEVRTKLIGKIASLESEIKSRQEIIDNISTMDTCPHCLQVVSNEHKNQIANSYLEDNNLSKPALEDCKNKLQKIDEILAKISVLNETIRTKKHTLETLDKDIVTNEIHYKSASERIVDIQDKIEPLEGEIKIIDNDISQLEVESNNIREDKEKAKTLDNLRVELSNKISNLKNTLHTHKTKIEFNQNNIVECQKKIDEYQKPLELPEGIDTLDKLIPKRDNLINENDQLVKLIDQYNQSIKYLGDDGIKAFLINKYIPKLNELVNKYLQDMGLFIQFELDAKFDETISANYMDSLSYNSLSEGQKQRVDLALLCAFRQISKMRNSMNTNLLILDEIVDGSLDSEGVTNFFEILKEADQNVFVISHDENTQDLFDNNITVEMDGQFSKYNMGN